MADEDLALHKPAPPTTTNAHRDIYILHVLPQLAPKILSKGLFMCYGYVDAIPNSAR